jgi:Phosphotransferase enzyme family
MDECLDCLSRIILGRVVLLHKTLPSAQQQIAIASIDVRNDKETKSSSAFEVVDERNGAQVGPVSPECDNVLGSADGDKAFVVVRRWLRSSRWWNLNAPAVLDPSSTAHDMARWEVAGYRVARKALGSLVPRVLYSSVDRIEDQEAPTSSSPWSVFEHVAGNGENAPSQYWFQSMVKVRHEFGYDEPHPRWGRVPADQCLEYSLLVLHQVVIPLHRYCRKHPLQSHNPDLLALCGYGASIPECRTFTFSGMVAIYENAHKSIRLQGLGGRDEGNANPSEPLYLHEPFQRAVDLAGQGIKSLKGLLESSSGTIPPMDLVLCHMDYQPQNLLFAPRNPKKVLAVLDWEEAAYADPRFDLLLLGRKVCANEQQARALWDAYEAQLAMERGGEEGASGAAKTPRLGSFEPWLHLETVHSLTTLLLQAVGGGGRSPWETQPELWDKIEREMLRLEQHERRHAEE